MDRFWKDPSHKNLRDYILTLKDDAVISQINSFQKENNNPKLEIPMVCDGGWKYYKLTIRKILLKLVIENPPRDSEIFQSDEE